MPAYLDEFIIIALAHFFAVASPGPDFAIVLKQSVQQGRANALWTSFGVGLGILVHVSYCLLGVALLLSQSETLFTVVKYIAALYLAYLGVQALRYAKPSSEHENMTEHTVTESNWNALKRGFLVNALNPKATLFFLSLFTLVIEPSTPSSVQLFYGIYMALATWLWFSLLAVILSKKNVRHFFQLAGHWFDRGIGVIMLLLAIRLVV
ncbi:LysE family transporter [Pseudoalteromonas sp. McH1-7]|uniref:LysE family translocator n=1 Tax=Pseudoalteromonas TaxID=53246 RepID=UPI001590F9E5|nr:MULTISPECIES: LysE family transporter [Pseudoalteromonas]MDW7550302.1 LysE family transporter [Pseudoalteromonas peptidolytica]NUZ10791.1 LysE family transporter [Pseudoalteromonas sp. McH1-7]USD28118.1 LysE family transporter [Pseudoalteromonas sp. SCSIO 43201]